MTPALPDRPPLPTYNDVRGSFNKYRSIAYGTWKPGEAKRFSEKSKRRNLDAIASSASATASSSSSFQKSHSESEDLIRKPQRDLPSASSESLDSPTLVPTEDEMSEIENCKTEPLLFSPLHKHQHLQNQQNQGAQTTPSLKKRSVTTTFDINNSTSTMTVSFEPDCYSSQDYINYCITKNQTYSTSTLPLACQIGMNRSMDALNDRLIHHGDFTQSLRRQKPSTSSVKLDPFNFAPQLHKRTRSFDGATHFAVISPSSKGGKLSTYGRKSTSTTLTTQKTGAFQATKNFIKKLYNNSTTLPKKLRSGKSSQKLDRIKAATSPFYEMRYPEPEEIPYLPYNIQYEVESDDIGNDEEETEMDIGNEEFDSSVAPSCSSSTSTATTHEKSINGGQNTHDEGIFSGSDEKSQTGSDFTAPSCISSSNRSTIATTTTVNPATTVPPEQFQSWNDLFGHLKKEITEMRARDAQILENLKSVESQLSYVKGIDRSKSEYSPLSRMLNAPTTIPAGSRESTSSSASTSTSTTSYRPPLRSTFV